MKVSKSKGIINIFMLNPWVLFFTLCISIVFTVIAIMSNIKTFNYTLPTYDELKVIEGTVENFSLGPGRNNVFFELTLNDKKTYYLNQYIAYDNNLPYVLQNGTNVKIWIDENYINGFPNQVYAIATNSDEYLLYEESCDFLISYYKDNLRSGNRMILFAVVICVYVCVSFAVQLLVKR